MIASTVAQYLAALPADRRAALSAVRKVINENLPKGYEEGIQFGMIKELPKTATGKIQKYILKLNGLLRSESSFLPVPLSLVTYHLWQFLLALVA
jgi:hypothetical protein